MTKKPAHQVTRRPLAPAQLAAITGGYTTSITLLNLQQQMQEQDRYFTSIDGILEARHETTKSTISNLA
jgi:hypothetical protein